MLVITMYRSLQMPILMGTLSVNGVWADTCLELLTAGRLEQPHPPPVRLSSIKADIWLITQRYNRLMQGCEDSTTRYLNI
jgi:hypothetical protein